MQQMLVIANAELDAALVRSLARPRLVRAVGIAVFLVALLAATTVAAAPAKTRNGKISFWSDRAFGGRAQVFVMNADGSRQRRLTSFIRDTEGGASPSLWIVGADGRGVHHVADGGRGVWSPDGTRLAIGGFGLTLMKPDGTEAHTVLTDESEPAAWSRDGRRLLFTSYRDGNPEVYLVGSDGIGLRRLTRKPGEDYAADFSPDGRKILFTSDRTGFRQVYVMNPDASGLRKLSRSRSNDWATSWQPLR